MPPQHPQQDQRTQLWHGHSRTPQTTTALGRALGRHLQGGDTIALTGELGAGKTQFVRGVTEGAGADPRAVSSPTYVIAQEYPTPDHGPVLVHLDGYRLDTEADLESIGWPDLITQNAHHANPDTILAVEWADRLQNHLPHRRIDVRIHHTTNEQRDITIAATGDWKPTKVTAMTKALQQAANEPPTPNNQTHRCPICRQPLTDQPPTFPFCSDRCKTIDLGRWADGRYLISRPIEQADLDQGE